ncbi:hypothetical protein Tco_0168817 [Tanacetum coccineum]
MEVTFNGGDSGGAGVAVGNWNDVLNESFKVVVFVLFSKVGLVSKEVIMRRSEKGSDDAAEKIVVAVKASKEIPKVACGLACTNFLPKTSWTNILAAILHWKTRMNSKVATFDIITCIVAIIKRYIFGYDIKILGKWEFQPERLARTYWVRRVRPIGYSVLGYFGTVFCISWVRCIVLLGYEVLAERVHFLIFDQSIIYNVYTDVDTAYSSKSGNGLLIRQCLGYVV